jgi:hypothetical protein
MPDLPVSSQKQKQRAKEVREAQFVIRYTPVAAVSSLGLVCFGVSRYLAEPGGETLLRLGGCVGFVLWGVALWQQARQTIRSGGKETWSVSPLLAFLVSVSGLYLADMAPTLPGALFYTLVSGTLMLAVACCFFLAWEFRQYHRTVPTQEQK